MPPAISEAFEDGIDLQIGLIDAYIPNDGSAWPGYPYVALRTTEQQEMRTFRTLILENPYLRVTLLPGMGGRIISLLDKRTQTEILKRHPMLEPQTGGRRGAWIREGIQVILDGAERLNSLGNVASQVEVQQDEDSEAAVWIGESVTGTGLSFHARLSLPPDRAELRLEVRVLNRTFVPQPYNGGLSVYLGEGEWNGMTFTSTERDAGLAFFREEDPFDGLSTEGGHHQVLRFSESGFLAPRQVDSWSLSIVPISGLGGCDAATPEAAACIRDGMLSIQSTQQRLGHKIYLLTQTGETLEAPVDLYPEHVLKLPIGDLNPLELALQDPGKRDLLRFEIGQSGRQVDEETAPSLSNSATVEISLMSSEETLRRATFNVATRHLAQTLMGTQALANQDFEIAVSHFERVLNFNAEDPLLWWGKAMAMRLAGQDPEAELLNAHYLAPLEPALRAEGFLSQPVSLDPEPNRLLSPLEENAEEFVEVACLLIEAGLFDQASRWIDEALRHGEMAMLRYLNAYCLLEATRLDMEAAEQIRIAAQTPLAPPFPFRKLEELAIVVLANAFPDDKHLRALCGWVGTVSRAS